MKMSTEENKSSNFKKCVLRALGKVDKCKSNTFTHTESYQINHKKYHYT